MSLAMASVVSYAGGAMGDGRGDGRRDSGGDGGGGDGGHDVDECRGFFTAKELSSSIEQKQKRLEINDELDNL